jgi:hypothetical protein
LTTISLKPHHLFVTNDQCFPRPIISDRII